MPVCKGNEIELEILCQLEHYEVIGQGQCKMLLYSFRPILHYLSRAPVSQIFFSVTLILFLGVDF